MELNLDGWDKLGEIPDDIVLREDKQRIGAMMHEAIKARCPVKTGRLRDSLVFRVLKRSVKWGSAGVPYYRRHQWRFAHITPREEAQLDERIEQSVQRFFDRIHAGSRPGR
ncbi:hypothetical protein KKB55_11055 [Myxococcota bacterium]|nr:hypothetical protein [Myxococcota bacterium]MBU1898275.1 hypothetical protein [Myxococcota bacterium]